MEKSFQFCSRKATIKALKSRAYALALNLDRMTRESFTKMTPKDMKNNRPSCSGVASPKPFGPDLVTKGPPLPSELLFPESDNNTRKEIDLHEENWLDAIELKETDVHVCEDDDGHFIPRKLLLFKGEKFKGESNGGLGVRKSIKTFRAPVSNCARSTAIEVLENERDGRHRVRKSTKTFRAPDPNSTRSAAIEGSWIGDNGSRRVIRKSTKTFRAPDPKSTRSSLVEYLIKCRWFQTQNQSKHPPAFDAESKSSLDSDD
uniref:Uncharacterized protein n=1 Tax=Magallana gigas TaxID=29159 RepID=K1QE78_MAGGI